MKKYLQKLAAFFTCGIIALSLAACGGSASSAANMGGSAGTNTALDAQNPITITMWHYYDGDLKSSLDTLVDEFNLSTGLENGVIVNAVPMGSIADLEENITNSAKGVINSQELPDIFFSYTDVAIEVDSYIELVNLEDYFTAEERAGYVQSFLEEGYVDGRLIVLPVVKSTELIYVNATEWLAFCAATGHTEADLETWEKLVATATEYYTYSDGNALFGFDTLANFLIVGLKQQGVDVFQAEADGTGSVHIDEAAMRNLFDIYYNGSVLGHFSAVSRFRSDDVKAGTLVSYAGSSSGASYFPTTVETENGQQEIEFIALEYPVFEGGNHHTVQQGAGVCVVASDNAHSEGAALFLKWFTSAQANISFSLETGYMPAMQASYTAPELAEGLAALQNGTAADKVTAAVYEVASTQILGGYAYSAPSFNGSYQARNALSYSLADMVAEDIEVALTLRENGYDDAAILAYFDTDLRFEEWLVDLRARLDRQEIPYV